MIRLLHIVSLIVAVALNAMAQPQATLLERQHDFGVILEENGKVTCQMHVVNTGTEPLVIIKATAGCGCTAVDFPETPIAPSDTAVVSITYNPSGRPGQFTKQVLLQTNTIPRRNTLEISGNVIPTTATLDQQYPLKAGPLRISQADIPFGELVKGSSKTQYLSCYNASTDTLLVHVHGDKPHLHPALVPDTVMPARVTALTVHYLAGHAPQWGFNTDTLTLTVQPLNSKSLVDSAHIQVMAQVLEDFSHLTDKQRQNAPVVSVDCGERLDFGTIKGTKPVTCTMTVTNKGKDMLIIRRVWAPDGEGVTATASKLELKRGKSATVAVTVDPSRVNGDILNVPLTLMTNDPDAPRLTVRLVGFIDK